MNACEYEVILIEEAGKQLASLAGDLFDYTGSKTVVGRLMTQLENEIYSLSNFPERHPLVERPVWKNRKIRKMVAGLFCVYYLVSNEHKLVIVCAIVPTRFDQIKQLRDQFDHAGTKEQSEKT